MKQKIKIFLYSIFFFFSLKASLRFESPSSILCVQNNTQFQLGKAINNFNGTLVIEPTAQISGQDINFKQGTLRKSGSQQVFSGVYSPSSEMVILSGNQGYRALGGMTQEGIVIAGVNNKLEGIPQLVTDINLQDSATEVNVAVMNALNKNIILNGGTVRLENNLAFLDDNTILGQGTVDLNGFQLRIGGISNWDSSIIWKNAADITLNSDLDFSGSFTFSSMDIINGNGHIFDLSPGGDLTISGTGILQFSDLVLKGIQNDSIFIEPNATIHFTNVTFMPAEDLAYNQGNFHVEGPTTIVQKDQDLSFIGTVTLVVDGITLWLDQAGAPALGNLSFGVPANLNIINDGAIKVAANEVPINSRLDILQTCCDELQTSTGFLQIQIDEKCSLIDINITMIDMLKTSTGQLQVDIDINESRLDAFETTLDEKCSLIDINESRIDGLETEVDANSSLIDINITMINMLKTSTGQLQSKLDHLSIDDISMLDEVIQELEELIDQKVITLGQEICRLLKMLELSIQQPNQIPLLRQRNLIENSISDELALQLN